MSRIIYADDELPYVEQAFADLGEVRLFDGRQTQPGMFDDGDMLLLRSVTRVDEALIGGSRLRFVATATAGVNHVDTGYLRQRDITFANAPGCNAIAASEYTLFGLLQLAQRRGRPLSEMRIGVVGCGQVGSRVVKLCQQLGAEVWQNDPPRAAREGDAGFEPLAKLAGADAICLHTPLTTTGAHPTQGLIDAGFIAALAPGTLLVSAGRGEVLDETALKSRLAAKADLWVHLDVWWHEPDIDRELLEMVTLASPHVAGYSLEGKLRGTQMIMEAAARNVGVRAGWDMSRVLPPTPALVMPEVQDETTLAELMSEVIGLQEDDRALRGGGNFDQLRRQYALRRELAAHCVQGEPRRLFQDIGLQSCAR